MRLPTYLTALFVAVFLTACGGGGGDGGTLSGPAGSTTVASTTTTTVPLLFTTAPPSLTLQKGTSSPPYIIGGGVAPYVANSESPSIVEVTATGSEFVIKAKGSGSALIVFVDSVGTKQAISVIVPDPDVLFTDLGSSSDISIGTTIFTTIFGGTPFTAAAPYVVNNSNPSVVKTVLSGTTLAITGLSTGSATSPSAMPRAS